MQADGLTCKMKKLIILNLVFILFSCNTMMNNWEKEWNKHQNDFKQIIFQLKANKFQMVYGRMGYAIPDSFDLQSTCGQLVFRETDFTYDNSHSILFHLNLDTNVVLRADPKIVYTDNKKRIKEYEAMIGNAIKIEKNWYFVK